MRRFECLVEILVKPVLTMNKKEFAVLRRSTVWVNSLIATANWTRVAPGLDRWGRWRRPLSPLAQASRGKSLRRLRYRIPARTLFYYNIIKDLFQEHSISFICSSKLSQYEYNIEKKIFINQAQYSHGEIIIDVYTDNQIIYARSEVQRGFQLICNINDRRRNWITPIARARSFRLVHRYLARDRVQRSWITFLNLIGDQSLIPELYVYM